MSAAANLRVERVKAAKVWSAAVRSLLQTEHINQGALSTKIGLSYSASYHWVAGSLPSLPAYEKAIKAFPALNVIDKKLLVPSIPRRSKKTAFATLLAATRMSLGLTVSELAHAVHVHRSSIDAYERGGKPVAAVYDRLCKAMPALKAAAPPVFAASVMPTGPRQKKRAAAPATSQRLKTAIDAQRLFLKAAVDVARSAEVTALLAALFKYAKEQRMDIDDIADVLWGGLG